MSIDLGPGGQREEILIECTRGTISSLCYTLAVPGQMEFYIFIDSDEKDEITEAIAKGTYSFAAGFHLLSELIRVGQRVLDLGAHIGTFSLFAAALGYQVVSVEASPYNSALLRKSAERNGFDRMRVISAAVYNQPGTVGFVPIGPYGFVSDSFTSSSTISVPAITVDDLLTDVGWDGVDFIKMDIEGSEVAAIQGMSQLLARDDAPVILYESNGHMLSLFGETPNHLMATLEGFGYRCYLVQPGRLIPCQSGDLQPECVVDYAAIKHLPVTLHSWQVAPPMSLEDRISRILSSCAHPNRHIRAYIVRALAKADSSILSDPRVVNAFAALATDPDADIRDAMVWWQGGKPPSPSIINELRQTTLEEDTGMVHLHDLMGGYGHGRFTRAMRALNHLWVKVKDWMK